METDRVPAAAPRRRLALDVDWRLVGMAALFGLVSPLHGWSDPLAEGNYRLALIRILTKEAQAMMFLLSGYLATRIPSNRVPLPVSLLLSVTLCSAIMMVVFPLSYSFEEGFPGGKPSPFTVTWFFARHLVLYWGILAMAWYFHVRATRRRAALHAAKLARRQLDTQLVEARLTVLQAQVEPHFLFNTLAHLKRLYKTDPALGGRMLERLCDYLQAALPRMRASAATLDSELALAEAYLEVQRLRMGDRLAFDIDVGDRDRQRPFPPMMLTSLVENAIKHGVNPLPEGGSVRVWTETTASALRVVVADSGRGISTLRGTGVGLANIRSRLAALYGATARVTLAPNKPRGLRATIEIPLPADGAKAAA